MWLPILAVIALLTCYASSFVCEPPSAPKPTRSTTHSDQHRRTLNWTSYTCLQTKHAGRESNLMASFQSDDVSRQLARAKELLEEAKAKMDKQQEKMKEVGEKDGSNNTVSTDTELRDRIIKSKNEETGLIMCDGDIMAELSESEEWEQRSLLDVFESEIEDDEITKQLASRDVTASIRNMRLKMHNEDYRRIFDKRNRFIGEDN